jgi:hypothetical protein
MTDTSTALRRAGRRVVFHMIQAGIEGLKAVEAVIEEIGAIGSADDDDGSERPERQKIEIE